MKDYHKEYRRKERNFRMQELYEDLQSIYKVAKVMGLTYSAVQRVLSSVGLTHPVCMRRITCLDCEKPTGGKTRCEFHRRVHLAALRRDYRAARKLEAAA